ASSGAASATEAPASGCSSSRAWSRPTVARSRSAARPAVAPSSDLSCPPVRPSSSDGLGGGGLRGDFPVGLCPPAARRWAVTFRPVDRAGRRGNHHMSAPNNSYDPVEVNALHPDEVARMRNEALDAIAKASSLEELKEVRLAHAGDRSPLALANREIGALPPAARADAGKRVGGARREVAEALKARQAQLEEERDARVLVEEAVDVTLPYDRTPRGARHPLTVIADRMADIFVGMGFEVAEGPEVEAEWYNFDALNFLPDHPARTMQDTFFVAGPDGGESGMVRRTHTSPVQVRALLDRELPVYVVVPGRTFRTDELDATHSPVFHQL